MAKMVSQVTAVSKANLASDSGDPGCCSILGSASEVARSGQLPLLSLLLLLLLLL